jgi:MFS transporter, FHS family, L-fucose permease
MAAPIASIGPAAGGTAAAAQDRVSCLMQSRSAEAVLAGAAVGACAVMLVAAIATGPVAMWALIAVGLFHAIMFPTILTLGIRGLGPLTEKGAGLLIMAIAGVSLVVVQGWAADRFGLQHSFLITAVCELYVMFSAVWGCRAPRAA